MSLTSVWSPYFQSKLRMQGRAYFLAGRVEQQPPEPGQLVRAQVRGRRQYEVVLTEGGDAQVHPSCTCPTFAGGTYCKHIWATLLDVQHNGRLVDRDGQSEAEDRDDNGDGAASTGAEDVSASLSRAPRLPKARKRTGRATGPQQQQQPEWTRQIALLRPPAHGQDRTAPNALPHDRQICYQLRPDMSARHNGLVIELMQRQPRRRGWTRTRAMKMNHELIGQLPDAADRELCSLLLGSTRVFDDEPDRPWTDDRAHAVFRAPRSAQRTLLDMLIRTGRCFVGLDDAAPPLSWDDVGREQPWVLWLVGRLTDLQTLEVTVELRRGDSRMPIDKPTMILGGPSGVLIHKHRAALFDDRDALRWVQQFRDDLRRTGETSPIVVPRRDIDRFLDRLYLLPQLPELDLPDEIARPEQVVEPQPHMEIFSPSAGGSAGAAASRDQLMARVWFAYGQTRVRPEQQGRFVSHAKTDDDVDDVVVMPLPGEQQTAGARAPDTDTPRPGTLIRRDLRFERDRLARLVSLGFRNNPADDGATLVLSSARVGAAIGRLLADGWRVQADQRVIRSPGTVGLSVASGVDWFELRGGLRYETENGESIVPLPELLAAARSGRNMVTLDDGSQGILPEEWLRQHGLLAAIGAIDGDHLRFRSSQAALLDALLAEQELVEVDDGFARARERVRQFTQLTPRSAAATFSGVLRHYQEEGVGWLEFLRWFDMGGVLADDMGLGKTIQVLAMLDQHYNAPGSGSPQSETGEALARPGAPSLVVVPRSVVYNWVDEAAKFTPNLRVRAYTGTDRHALRDDFDKLDVIVTSYGLLRRDAAELSEQPFHYAILDEAQAIKNPQSQGAKAARLLNASHRLALTGTPVENHLGDLWSIFEFLNPGMLGSNSMFSDLLRGGVSDPRSVEAARQAGVALRPFILRRTKKQVLSELPEKTEQTLLCEMGEEQRRLYDQLRNHYRGTLLKQVDAKSNGGFGKSTVLVLEALLRLRQAACHPGLIDTTRTTHDSAKLDTLIDNVEEIIEEGSKALVFSQFTSFLALARKQLDERGVAYEYLDGQTRDRKKPVERFQNDPKCPLFLISLKAGGLGLNLTAAEYVFILDPWWNPAVEQQAIDRAHRIGQTRRVFAYRLICEDTVEQRIAELQAQKRELAEAIIGGEQSLMKSLTREDLEQLLS